MNLRTPIQDAPISVSVFSEKDDIQFGPIQFKRFTCLAETISENDKEINDFMANNDLYIMNISQANIGNLFVTTISYRTMKKVKTKTVDNQILKHMLQANIGGTSATF